MSPVYGVKETEPGWWRITRNDVPTGDWYHREGLAQFALNELGRKIARLQEGRVRRRQLGLTRPRDSQKSKLYAAENAALHFREDNRKMTLAEAQELVNRCLRRIPADPYLHPEVRIGRWKILVKVGRGGGKASASGHRMWLGVWARQRAVVLHELAHCVCRVEERHGRNFARIYLKIVRRFWGVEAAAALQAAYQKYGVKHHAKRHWKGSPAQRAALARGQATLAARRAEGGER